jgi:hypothetical protein
MAESAPEQHNRPWTRIASMVLVALALGASTALAATVTQPPTISGDPAPGAELTASRGDWTPSNATPSYDWLRCNATGAACAGITGACGQRYTVRKADEGHTLRVRLTVTEASGDAASTESQPTSVVEPTIYPIPGETEPDTCIKVTPTGPGQGTFTSGTQTGGGSEPSPDTSLAFIDPFPVIRISGRFRGRRTTLTRVTVRAPKGTRIRINCKGRGCPYKRRAIAVRLLRIRALQRVYRPRATIELRVTEPGKIGKYTRLRTRRGKAPVRLDRCLMPGRTRPVRCPTG